jgi:hypothetical protein
MAVSIVAKWLVSADMEAPRSVGMEVLRCYFTSLQYRRQIRKVAANKYENRLKKKMAYEDTRPKESYHLNPVDEIFSGDTLEKASEIETQVLERKMKEIETAVSKSSSTKLKKNNSRKLKDPNKQNKKLKQKKTGKNLKEEKADKQDKKFKKWKGTKARRKVSFNKKVAPFEM